MAKDQNGTVTFSTKKGQIINRTASKKRPKNVESEKVRI